LEGLTLPKLALVSISARSSLRLSLVSTPPCRRLVSAVATDERDDCYERIAAGILITVLERGANQP